MTPGEGDGALGSPDPSVRSPVGPGQRHRRRVVVQLGAVDPERRHRVEHQPVEEAGPVCVEQQAKRPADPVVVQEPRLAALQPEQSGIEGRGPLTQRVDRLVGQCQVAHQHAEALCRCQLHPAVCCRDEGLEQVLNPELTKVVVHDRQRPQHLGPQPKWGTPGGGTCRHVCHCIQ